MVHTQVATPSSKVAGGIDQNMLRVLAHNGVLLQRNEVLAKEIVDLRNANEKLRKENTSWRRQMVEQRQRAQVAEAKVAGLETALLYATPTKNSTNSSSPPSTDNEYTKPRYPKREKSKQKTGGQKGHKGSSSKRRTPTKTIRYEPTGACTCGLPAGEGNVTGEATKQVVGVEIVLKVEDHTQVTRTCSCGHENTGVIPADVVPAGVKNPVVYHDSIKALVVSLVSYAHVPTMVVRNWFRDMLGIKISQASIIAWCLQAGQGLASWADEIKKFLKQEPVVGSDETPMRVDGFKNAHAHCVVSTLATFLFLAGRSKADIESSGILKNHPGVLVVDGYSSYRSLGVGFIQTCLAHLLRDLEALIQTFTPHDTTILHPYPSIFELKNLLQGSIHESNLARVNPDQPLPDYDLWVDKIAKACEKVEEQLADAPDSSAIKDTHRLIRHITKCLNNGELLLFLTNLKIPPTNNWSERVVRNIKVAQRRSGTRRSTKHAAAYLQLLGYMDTARKNNVEPSTALQLLLKGSPYLPTHDTKP